MRIRSSLCLLISAVFLAAVPAASAGLRGTVNAQHTLSAVERWSHSPVCVALRGRGAGTIPCYQRTSPPYCRTVQYDAALEAAFWAAFDEAENQNQAILIGTYISGARVQDEWWDWPISAIDEEELGIPAGLGGCSLEHEEWEACWTHSNPDNYPDFVNVDNQAARNAFIAELIEEAQYRRQRAEAHDPNISLDILYLDNIGHPAFVVDEREYQWANQMAVLSAVKQDANAASQRLFANVAIAPLTQQKSTIMPPPASEVIWYLE